MFGAKEMFRSRARCGVARVLWATVAVFVFCSDVRVSAFEEKGRAGMLQYHVIAPDWAWVGENFNVLVVLESDRPIRASLNLWYDTEIFEVSSTDTEEHLPGERWWQGEVDGVLRFAFKKIAPRRLSEKPALFRLAVNDASGHVSVGPHLEFPVATVRGPVVRRTDEGTDWWSIGVQVSVAILAIPAFLIFLRIFGRRGGWKTPQDAEIPETEERWWNEKA